MPDNLVYIENNGNYFLAGDGNRYYVIDRIGYNLNTLESNGNYSLAEGGTYNQYYIFDSNGNSIGLTDSSGNPVSSNNGNSVVQAEEGPDGGFHVLWSGPQGIIPSNGPIMAWKVDASGQYQNHIYENIDYHETTFQIDLNGGGITTLSHGNNNSLTDISGNQNHIINNSVVLKSIDGAPVGPDTYGQPAYVASDGGVPQKVEWNAVQVEQNAAGGFEVMWIDVGSDTPLDPLAWKTDVTGEYITHKILTDELRNAHESSYKFDLDGDGRVTLETNGDYELAISGNQYQIIEIGGDSLNYLESNGDYKLAKGGDQFYIVDSSGNSIRYVDSYIEYMRTAGWTDIQVEETENAWNGFEVLFHHENHGYWSLGVNTAGELTHNIVNVTDDRHESWFQVDLNGDGNIASKSHVRGGLTDISGNKHHEVDGYGASGTTTSFGNSNRSDGWGATQVEAGSESGTFEVFWSNTDGRSEVTKINDTGKFQSTITREMVAHETVFQADLDGDGAVGLNLVSIETNGSYKLSTSHNQYYIIDNNNSIVTSFDSSNISEGWGATQVEASAGGGFEVFWSNTDGRTTAHKISEMGVYQSTITRTLDQHETAFQVDLDGDGIVGLNLVSIETNGSYELATSNSKYQIIDSHDSIVTSFGNSNRGDGWSVTQVEAGSESGTFEVFWSNTDGRSEVTKINDTGKFQSTITREMVAHETVFQADLDGDGLTTIETNGEFKFIGGVGNDTINGGAGNDTLDGGKGSDTITTGNGSDQIILRIGDGGNTLLDADIITDFTVESDDFGLTNGLSFGDLKKSQGTDDYANDSIISHGLEYLAILRNIDESHLTEADFVNVDIA